MRIAGMLLLAAAAVPTVIGLPAYAAFTELSYTTSFEQLWSGEQVVRYRVYANFNSDQDRVVAVSCGSVQGQQQFYQSPFGAWTEPSGVLIPIFPDLAFDTFVTVGQPALPQGIQGSVPTLIAAGSTFGFADFEAGWYAPVDAPYTHGPSVLIAQLTVRGILGLTGVELDIALDWMDASGSSHHSCMSMALDPKVVFPCLWPHRADINHDCEVNGIDLALLLGEWGVSVDCELFGPPPPPVECPAGDMSCDGSVNGIDLAMLLAEWGPVNCQLGR